MFIINLSNLTRNAILDKWSQFHFQVSPSCYTALALADVYSFLGNEVLFDSLAITITYNKTTV